MTSGPRPAHTAGRISLLIAFIAACLVTPGCGDAISREAGTIELPAKSPERQPIKHPARKTIRKLG